MPTVEPASLATPNTAPPGGQQAGETPPHVAAASARADGETVEHDHDHVHRDVNGGWLRAGTFGAMDGLVTNVALIAGFAGGSVNNKTVVLAGMAGLVAG